MTILRRKLNSMFYNKVNFIFTRELSYSCCGNHHFGSLNSGAFKFSSSALHSAVCSAWTLAAFTPRPGDAELGDLSGSNVAAF